MIVLRPYEPQRDALQVYALWQQALGHLWPLQYETFQAVTVAAPVYQQGDHFVALSDGEIVGWVATQLSSPATGHLLALLVAPAFQRRGVGSTLHDQALISLKQRGATTIQLGGGYSYLWQGVPTNLPGAWAFFQALNWTLPQRNG